MFKKIFKDIISLLPEEFLNNNLFNNIIAKLTEELPTNLNGKISRISVSKDLYIKLTSLYPEITDNLYINEEETSLLNITTYNKDGLIIIRIKKEFYTSSIKIVAVDSNCQEKHLQLMLSDNFTKLESLLKEEKNGFITKYDYDLQLYDKENRVVIIDYEKEKDIKFSEEFLIPLSNARELRNNFKQNIEFLNINRIKEMNRLVDSDLNDNLFRGPFNIADLELFIKTEMINDLKEILNDISMSFKLTNELNNIVSSINHAIGNSNKVLISENMYQFLQNYLLGLYNHVLYNKGILIKELNGIYTLYYIHFENNQIIAIPKELTADDIDLIITNNNQSANLNNLKDFFGISNSLK